VGTILVTDDDARSRELTEAHLRRSRHRVVSAASGAEALERARLDPPDLALVDLDLPGEGGLSTMRQLKHQGAGEYLPVIVVVPFGDMETRLGAWQAGADEVMVKPLHREELLVRIDNLVELRAERLAVAGSNRELRRLQGFKTTLDQLLDHDLKNPLAALSANLDYVGQELPDDSSPDLLDAVRDATTAARRLQRMVASILDVSRFEEGALIPRRSPTPLAPLLDELSRLHRRAAQDRAVTIEVDCPADLELDVDRDLFTRVIENLFEASLRRTRRGGTVSMRAARSAPGGPPRVVVCCTGHPVPDALRPHLFDKYGAVEARDGAQRVGAGLGLYFCRLALEAHGGRVSLGEGEGLTFVVELPPSAHPAPGPTA
jgi:two-component system sensor histidine kinase/response regulator